jgi:hypothetical protein
MSEVSKDEPGEAETEAKGYKGYNLTPKEANGRVKADMSGWRKQLQASKIGFDDTRKGIYLRHLSEFGRKMQAARCAGVSANCVLDHYNNDSEFAAAVEEALKDYADRVQALAWKLMEGVKKPIVGGKFKDEIITHEIVHATNLLAMEMKKTNPEYKDRSEVDLNQKGGGLIVVPAGVTPEDFVREMAEVAKTAVQPGLDKPK